MYSIHTRSLIFVLLRALFFLRSCPPIHLKIPDFAKQLAAPFDLFVNDAFGTAHRAHGSTEGVTKFLSPSVAGFLLQKELDYLEGAVKEPKRPFAAIVGGSKVSSKIGKKKSCCSICCVFVVVDRRGGCDGEITLMWLSFVDFPVSLGRVVRLVLYLVLPSSSGF